MKDTGAEREEDQLVQGHTASETQRLGLAPSLLSPVWV